mgnify:CR=1 FL=1
MWKISRSFNFLENQEIINLMFYKSMEKNRKMERSKKFSASCRKLFAVGVGMLIWMLLTPPDVFGQQKAKLISLKLDKVTVLEAVKEINRLSGNSISYKREELEKEIGQISLDLKDVQVVKAVETVLQGTRLAAITQGEIILIVPRKGDVDSNRKSFRVKGFVYDTQKQPLPGVTVKVVGVAVGTATNEKGWFAIDLPMQKGALEFSFVGFKKKVVEFSEKMAKDSLRVVMEEDVQSLDETIVVAYGNTTRRKSTGAISVVKAEELRGIPAANVAALLQGRVAGMDVTQMSGAPGGGGTAVTIRGYNSLDVEQGRRFSDPLWVVDGVPMNSFSSPITGTNLLADLNPDMIESIQVLKDASSAAIYGSRAANGVILVTTKKGKVGEAKFSANASYSISQLMEYPEQTGGRMERWLELKFRRNIKNNYYDWATGKYHVPTSYEDVYNNGNGIYDQFWGNGYWGSPSMIHSLQDSLDPYYNNSTNWWKYAFRRSKVVNANVQAVGGTERFRYMVGLGYYDEQGIMINSGYKRANLISNLTAQFTPKLRMDTRVYLSYVDRTMNRSSSSASSKHTRYEGLSVNPSQQLTVLPATKELEAEWKKSVLGIKDRTDDYRAMVTAFLEYELLKGLTFSASGNIDYSQSNLNKYTPGVFDEYHNESKSEGNIGRQVMLSSEELLHYNTSVNDVHNIDVLLGINTNKEQAFSMYGYGLRGVSDDVYYYNPQKVPPVVNHGTPEFPEYAATRYYSSDFTEKRMVSYFGRLGYNYKQRYLLEFTFRRDGSSTFGEGNRWANFPSVAVGWSFSEEPFIKRLTGSWLNWGKIRGSYGKSGQTFTSAYLAHGLMNIMDRNFFGKTGVTTDKPVSPYLTWEKTNQYDLGLDMDMFNYRLNMKLDYYYKYTSSLIYDIPIPGSLYTFGAQVENAMEISNEGLELELQADILRESAVSWRMKFNMARNWNRFEKSYSGKDVVDGDGTLLVAGRPLNGLYVWAHRGYYNSDAEVPRLYKIDGQEIYFNGVATDGISGAVGNYRLLDLDGDGNPDSYYAGSPLPLAHGGWVNELMWKNFDLNVLVNFTIGRKMINNRMGLGFSTQSENGHLTKLFDYRKLRPWDGVNKNPNAPAWGNSLSMNTDSAIEKVHHLALKQITLGYNLPDRISKKAGLSGVRFFLTAENLFYLSNYSGGNPEVVNIYTGRDNGDTYPLPRKYTLGLTLNF